MKKTFALFLLTTICIANQASAILYVGQFAGNDSTAVVEPLLGVGTLTQLKVNEPATSDGLFSVTYNGGAPSVDGTWSFLGSSDATKMVAGLVVKAGNEFNLYEFTGAMAHTAGTDIGGIWSTADGVMTGDTLGLNNPQGSPKEISHLSLYLKDAGPSVPDSGNTLILLGLGLGLLGFLRRRK